MQDDCPISDVPDHKLTYRLWLAGKAWAVAERNYEIKQHQRLVLLEEMTKQAIGKTQKECERNARISPEYKAFLLELGEAKEQKIYARVEYDVIDHEIKLRIARGYQDRAEYKAGGMQV